MKNKWLLLTLLIWAIIFSIPPLRACVKAMVNGSPWIHFTVLPRNWDSRFGPNSPELPIRVHAIKGGVDTFEWPSNFQALDKFDALLQKNPNLPWLIALRLQVTTIVFKTNRVGGELSDGRLPEHLKAGIPSPETNGEKANFTPEQMQCTLALCRLGEKLEPQNAFFSFMRACFLLMNWQDQKAWQAMDEAAHKTYWNDHYTEFINLYTHVTGKVVNRPLLPMEALNIPAVSENPFPQSGELREMARIINWEGIKLKRADKNAQALQIWNNFHHTMFLAAQGDADAVDFVIDYAMMSIAQSGATYPDRNGLIARLKEKPKNTASPFSKQGRIENEKLREKALNGFIAYAQKYHRPDLAKQISDDAQQAHRLFQQSEKYNDANFNVFYPSGKLHVQLQFHRLYLTGSFFFISVALLLSLFGSLFIWLILSCCHFFFRRKSTFTSRIVPPSCKENILGAEVCSGLWPLFCITVLIYLFESITQNTASTLLPFTIHFSLHHLIDTFLNIGGLLNNAGTTLQIWRSFILILPLLACGLYVLQKRVEWQAKTDGKKVWSGWALLRQFFTRRWDVKFIRALLGWLGKKIYVLLLFAGWIALANLTQESSLPVFLLAIAIIFVLITTIVLMLHASRRAPLEYSLQLFQRSVAGWICASSVLVLLLLISQSMINSKLQPWANNQIHGEMHLFHQVQDSPS